MNSRFQPVQTFWRDLRFSARLLARSPGFTAIAVLALALGIGAATAIFSVVYAAILQPLPYSHPERIMRVYEVSDSGAKNSMSDPNFEDLHDANRSFESLAEYGSSPVTVTGGKEAMRLVSAIVSKEFFAAMGVQPVAGRGFLPEEEQFGGAPVAMVSYAFWQRSMAGDRELAGKHLTFDNKSYTVVGVLPAGFRFPDDADLWVPREQFERNARTALNWRVIGRLKPGVTIQEARTDLSHTAHVLLQQYGQDTWMTDAAVVPLQEALVGNARMVLLLLLGAAGVLLLAACANTANLLLARSGSRQKELAVRLAMGASRGRLLGQFFAESMTLAFLGAVVGTAFAIWGVQLLIGMDPANIPGVTTVQINVPVLLFSLAVCLLTACGLSFVLALRATRKNVFETLKETQQRQSGSKKTARVRAALMVSQLAGATVLLAGAALLGQSLVRLMNVQPGYRTDHVLAVQMYPPEAQSEAQKVLRVHMMDEMLQRLSAVPGVESAGVVRNIPLGGELANGLFLKVEKQDEIKSFEDFDRVKRSTGQSDEAYYQVASAGYFKSLGIPLLQGRLIEGSDTFDSPQVALISQSLARQSWPGENPIGHHVEFGNMDGDLRLLKIVGVVGDVHGRGLEAPAEPTIYVDYRQRVPDSFSVVLHTPGSEAAVVPAVRGLLHDLDPELAPSFRTFHSMLASSVAGRQFQLVLLGAFGAAALLLALMGLYGVTSYLVSERTQEIGIRMALGASKRDILKVVLRQGAAVVGAGLLLGVCGVLALTGVLRGMLFGIAPTDPSSMAAVCAVLVATSVLACWIPARRASRVDPMVALRYE